MAGKHVIKRLIVNCDTPGQYLHFNWTSFFIFIIVWHHVTFTLRVFHPWQTNFASYEESTGSPVWGLF